MKILPSGNWSHDWTDYHNRGPAVAYYRKRDIVHAFKLYGHSGTETPTTEIRTYTVAAYFVLVNVVPFRVVYD